jgi:hypothetical protein
MINNIEKQTWNIPDQEISFYSNVSKWTEDVFSNIKNEENVMWVSASIEDNPNNSVSYIINKDLILKTRRILADYLKFQKDFCKEYDKKYSRITETVYLRLSNESDRKNYEESFINPNSVLSVILFLNDDYKGGELYFPDHDLTIKPKQNQLLIFPTKSRNYQISEITEGSQYVFAKFLE